MTLATSLEGLGPIIFLNFDSILHCHRNTCCLWPCSCQPHKHGWGFFWITYSTLATLYGSETLFFYKFLLFSRTLATPTPALWTHAHAKRWWCHLPMTPTPMSLTCKMLESTSMSQCCHCRWEFVRIYELMKLRIFNIKTNWFQLRIHMTLRTFVLCPKMSRSIFPKRTWSM